MKKIIFLLFFLTPLKNVAQEIHWLTFAQMLEAHRKQPKKVIVDIYTDWCGWCKKLDKDVYENPVIEKYIGENFYAVKMNSETEGQVVFQGDTFKLLPHNGRKLTNTLALKLMNNRSAYPTTAFLDEKLSLFTSIPGYMEAKEYEAVIKYFSQNAYKTQSWDDYKLKFVAESK